MSTMTMPTLAEVAAWLKQKYKLTAEDSSYVGGLVLKVQSGGELGERATLRLVESFTVNDTDAPSAKTIVRKLLEGFRAEFEVRKVELPGESKSKTNGKPTKTKVSPNGKGEVKRERKRAVSTVPPERPLSQGMGYRQARVLKRLIDSTPQTFDPKDADSGGLVLDTERNVFLSLQARDLCQIVDALIRTPSQRLRWGRKVLALLPQALTVLDDYIQRNPEEADSFSIK